MPCGDAGPALSLFHPGRPPDVQFEGAEHTASGPVEPRGRQADVDRLAVRGQPHVALAHSGEVDERVDGPAGDGRAARPCDEAGEPAHILLVVDDDLEVANRCVELADVLDRLEQHGLAAVDLVSAEAPAWERHDREPGDDQHRRRPPAPRTRR